MVWPTCGSQVNVPDPDPAEDDDELDDEELDEDDDELDEEELCGTTTV
jgi:hypothetical protein